MWSFAPVVCNVNSSDPNECDTSACDPTYGNCTLTTHQCVVNSSVIVAAALTAAALVGIVVAVLACVGFSSAATYAAYYKLNDGVDVTIVNNPLYEDAGKGGENPMNKMTNVGGTDD